jgi:hypothetical protein
MCRSQQQAPDCSNSRIAGLNTTRRTDTYPHFLRPAWAEILRWSISNLIDSLIRIRDNVKPTIPVSGL